VQRRTAASSPEAGESPEKQPEASALRHSMVRRRLAPDASDSGEAQTTSAPSRAALERSAGARLLADRLERLARSPSTVLFEGETGVGKTFYARLLHEASPRAAEPLRVVNCAALPESLLESELFGHERGSFTGAVASRVGALEAAGEGSVVLDEIGELSLVNQAKLLRALEDRCFERIGSNRTVRLRARLLCATNRDLDDLVTRGLFREDLLFRIAVVRFRVPPLRERPEDIVPLAHHLLLELARTTGRDVVNFSGDALDVIRRHPWRGNVRELRSAIEYAIALGEGPIICAADLPLTISGRAPLVPEDDGETIRLPCPLAEVERRCIEAALRATGGNRLRAAKLLRISRTTLYSRIESYQAEERTGERATLTRGRDRTG
jgi:two-component system response regulator HydG